MTDSWYLLDELAARINDLGSEDKREDLARLFAPLSANLADMLFIGTSKAELLDGALRSAAILDAFRTGHDLDETSPAFLAGRLATHVDLLGFVARSVAPDNLPELAKAEIETLRCLIQKPLTNKEVAAEREISEETACRSLRVCRTLDLVETERRGRTNSNRLTRLGMALFDEGHVPSDGKTAPYDMGRVLKRSKPGNLKKGSEMPQISVQP